jgi:osmotically-inducible protein OsmY
MNVHDKKPEWRRLIAALALGLGVAACQDKPPETIARVMDDGKAAGQPASPAGAIAGTAEAKMAQEGDLTRRATSADAALAERVKAALGADPALKTIAVDVAASGNAVTLIGTADNTANRDKASLIALSVQGVNSVENRIVIVRGS